MKRRITYLFFILFLLSSHNFWGLVPVYRYPVTIGGANIYIEDICFILFFILALPFNYKNHNREKQILHLKKPILFFAIYSLFIIFYSLASNATYTNTLRGASQLLYYLMYFGIPFLIRSRKELRSFLIIITINCAIALVVNLFQNITGWQPSFVQGLGHFSRTVYAGGFYRTYNPSFQWIIFSLCFIYPLVLFDRVTLVRITLLTVLCASIILTFTRNTYFGFMVTTTFFLIISLIKPSTVFKSWKPIFIILILASSLYYVSSRSYTFRRRIDSSITELTNKSGTFLERLNLFEMALSYLKNEKLFFGFGFKRLFNYRLWSEIRPLDVLQSGADSGMVDILFRLGIIGAFIYVLMHYQFFHNSWIRIRKCKTTSASLFFSGAMAYTLFIWTQSFANNVFLNKSCSIIIIIIWAVADIIWRFEDESIKNLRKQY